MNGQVILKETFDYGSEVALEFDPRMVGFHANNLDKIAFGQNQLQNPPYEASEEADGIATRRLQLGIMPA